MLYRWKSWYLTMRPSKLRMPSMGGEYGRMVVTLTLDGDNLDGSMNVLQFGLDVPLVATRKTE